MKLRDKYISTSGAANANPKNLPIISDEAFAMCDLLEAVVDKLEKLRGKII